IKFVSGGFQSFFADIFYIRGILALTDTFSTYQEKVEWIQKIFGTALSLDPYLTEGYFFAGVVIARDRESFKKGISFLERHMLLNPSEWRIPYWIGFNYYQIGEYVKAAHFYRRASLLPGSPPFLRSNQAVFYYLAGREELGVLYLKGLLQAVKDPRQLEWITTKLKWLQTLVFLNKKVQEYVSLYGRYPTTLQELVDKHLLSTIPEDPFGKGYYFDKQQKRVRSKFGVVLEGPYAPEK
ncbi:hypothetical protein DRO38_04355, partial [Candidatus Bathyarchaeota archaeon]